MKKVSLVLLIIALTLVAKFLFENLGGTPFVFKYNLKTTEKEVSLLLQSGGEVESNPREQVFSSPASLTALSDPVPSVSQEKAPPSK